VSPVPEPGPWVAAVAGPIASGEIERTGPRG
jgi:hypothetical protein